MNLLKNRPGESPWHNVGNIDHYEYDAGPNGDAIRVFLDADDGGFEQDLPATLTGGRFHIHAEFLRSGRDAAEGLLYLMDEIFTFQRGWVAAPDWFVLDFVWVVQSISDRLTFRILCGLGVEFLVRKLSVVKLPEIGDA